MNIATIEVEFRLHRARHGRQGAAHRPRAESCGRRHYRQHPPRRPAPRPRPALRRPHPPARRAQLRRPRRPRSRHPRAHQPDHGPPQPGPRHPGSRPRPAPHSTRTRPHPAPPPAAHRAHIIMEETAPTLGEAPRRPPSRAETPPTARRKQCVASSMTSGKGGLSGYELRPHQLRVVPLRGPVFTTPRRRRREAFRP